MYFLVEGDQQFTLLSIAVGATSEAVLITDTAGKILFLNRQFEELWHLTPGWMETITQHDRIWDLAYQVIDPEQFLSRIDGLYAH
ncbi:PAS domain-containing protein, partial [Roseiflexus sp.]